MPKPRTETQRKIDKAKHGKLNPFESVVRETGRVRKAIRGTDALIKDLEDRVLKLQNKLDKAGGFKKQNI